MGTLYLVGTPIGNLGDLSPRAAEILKTVDFIAAEDTRVTLKLLNHFGIKKTLISYHEHNAASRGPELLQRLMGGEDGAMVTDAGMPCISDPGEALVGRANRVVALKVASSASGKNERTVYVRTIADESKLAYYEWVQRNIDIVDKLSGGEKQRLSVALALINRPEIVFLDELTTGLDTAARREVWRHLKELKRKGTTIFLTTHYMEEAESLCDRIFLTKDGKKVTEGTVREVIENSPYDTLEEAYLWYMGEEVER